MKTPILGAIALAVLAAGFAAGSWHARSKSIAVGSTGERKVLYYVDPMNPAHTADRPGLAPCGMKMEPVYAGEAGTSATASGGVLLPGSVSVTAEKQQLIGVRVAAVEKKALPLKLRLLGRVAADETRVFRINATVDGWITKAEPLATGSPVRKDQTLATFYSPEFLSAAQALMFALTSQDRVQAAGSVTSAQSNQIAQFNLNLQQYRDSLRNLGMGELQIEEMIHSRKFVSQVNIASPAAGFITARNLSEGQRFEKGTELFRVTDLGRVWILVDAFERDARRLKAGAQVRVSLPNQGQSLAAVVSEALPQFDTVTRTLKVRLEADNPDIALKPDMFVDVELGATLPESLVVPADAILDAGLRKTVFVDRGNGHFEPRVVQTGERSGGEVQILQGLMADERIVVSGNFLLDSESRMKLAAAGVHGAPTQDPVCGMAVDEQKARAAGRVHEYSGKTYLFCNEGCKAEFVAAPEKFLKPSATSSASPTNAVPPRDQPHH